MKNFRTVVSSTVLFAFTLSACQSNDYNYPPTPYAVSQTCPSNSTCTMKTRDEGFATKTSAIGSAIAAILLMGGLGAAAVINSKKGNGNPNGQRY